MIKIILFKDKEHNPKGFQCSGHAGYSDYGTDIICASVSILSQNTVNSVEMFTKDKFDYSEDDGYSKFVFKDIPSDAGRLLFNSFELGVKSIRDSYGKKYIRIENQEV
ncbi:MAG: ribosomal-processing cysteine protease Prp [Lachnospiraceae bacterium]|nr:ribosomal-processing cysteine protease Prp [Lachnospiraceae bacterium]